MVRVAFIGLVAAVAPQRAGAWGECGHDVITRVAVRLLIVRTNDNRAVTRPFSSREHMLSHLSNVPDIVWRRAPAETIRLNRPTHWIALDHLAAEPTFERLPKEWAAAKRLARTRGHDLATEVGTVPWRVGQLARLMEEALRQVPSGSNREQLAGPVGEALLYAGLLSHFVGDQANPDHSISAHDGWHQGQGGIHAYFESLLCDAQPLDIHKLVFDHAQQRQPLTRLLARMPAAERRQAMSPVGLTFLVTLDSYRQHGRMLALDRKHALLAPSSKSPTRLPATRRDPAAVAPKQRSFMVERLALGADAVATLWLDAWQRAGRPDMKAYKSYTYPPTPEFVMPDYLP